MFKLPKLPFDLLIGNFSFASDGLPSASMLPGVLPYMQFISDDSSTKMDKEIVFKYVIDTYRSLYDSIWRGHSKRAKRVRSLFKIRAGHKVSDI